MAKWTAPTLGARVFLETGEPPEIPTVKRDGIEKEPNAVQIPKNSPVNILAGLISPNQKNSLLLVTGPSGAGKTQWCMMLADLAQAQGLRVRGLVSPAVLEDGQKTGIDLKNLETGEVRRLARRKRAEDGDVRLENWQVAEETLQWGNSILEQVKPCDLFILDEVGPLEFEHGAGLIAGFQILDTAKDFPCVVVVRPSLIQKAQARWHWAQALDVSSEAGS
jgi:nucleoside-triphosphatase THEP1